MDLGRNILIHALVLLVILSCGVSNSDTKPVKDLTKEIVGHWEYGNKSIRFTEIGTFQDSTFSTTGQLFNNHSCEVKENDTKVPILVISGSYAIIDTLLEFSSLSISLSCNPEPVVHRSFPYHNKLISISNDSLSLQSLNVFYRKGISDTGLLGTWKTVNKGFVYTNKLETGFGFGDITQEMTFTEQSLSSIFYDTVLPDDSIKYESPYFYDPPNLYDSCCAYPIIYLVDINGNEMKWVNQNQEQVYIYNKN